MTVTRASEFVEDRLAPRPRAIPSPTLHLIGIALGFAAAGMVLSACVDAVAGGRDTVELSVAAAITGIAGAALWRGSRVPEAVAPTSAFAAASFTWIAVSVAGALPYLLTGTFATVDDALFESVSGFTATGSTVLSPIEGTGRGLLFWRQLTQWYGGMGMIVLAVAVLPWLGIGGQELIQAEGPGPTTEGIAPRVSDTAKRLWFVYLGLTALVALGLLAVGLDLYDSVAHALTAVSTGGFSPYDASIAHFDSVAVETVLMAGMFLGATSFILLWRWLVQRDWRAPLRSSELRFYLGVVVIAVLVVLAILVGTGSGVTEALRSSSFNVVSLVTTCGFGTVDYVGWVAGAQLVLLALMVSGGMSGSTSGAVKLFRVKVMGRFWRREMRRSRHPREVVPISFGDVSVPEDTVRRIVGFVLAYFIAAVAGVVGVVLLGSDPVTAIGGAVTSVGGVGPGLGEAGPASNFLVFSRPARGILMLLMLLGRLEIFPMVLMLAAATRSVRGLRHRRRAAETRASRSREPLRVRVTPKGRR